MFQFCLVVIQDARFMPIIIYPQYQRVAKLKRLDCVKKIDNNPGDILHMAKEGINYRKVREKKRPSLNDSFSFTCGKIIFRNRVEPFTVNHATS